MKSIPDRLFFPNLDALRCLAFMSVFVHHSFHTDDAALKGHAILTALRHLQRPGSLGVNFFFVLSGFLITFLLLEEKRRTGRIDIGSFYVRRALRIWPLYFVVLLIGFVLFPMAKRWLGLPANETATVWKYVLFLGNFDIISDGRLPDASVLGVLWSLAVEEQFYLLWPLLLSLLPVRHYPILFLFIIVGGCLYRAVYLQDKLRMAFSTFAASSDLAVGAVLAYYSWCKHRLLVQMRGMSARSIGVIYVLGLGAVLWLHELELRGHWPIGILSRLLISLFFAFVIWEQNEAENSPFKLGRRRLLSALGRVSYGLYCLHFIGILVVIQLNRVLVGLNTHWVHVVVLETTFALALTIGLSLLSYRYLESPFLRLKRRFAVKAPASRSRSS